MNKLRHLYFFLFVFSLIASLQSLNSATVQIINNCADLSVPKVDVWINNVKKYSNLEFRKATSWSAVTTVSVAIAVTNANSTDTVNALINKTMTMGFTTNYVIAINGIVSANGYTPKKSFDLSIYDKGKITSSNPANADLLFLNGSTDSPGLDVLETKVKLGKIVDNIVYNEYKDYVSLAAVDYELMVRANGATDSIARYDVPLGSLQAKGYAIVVFGSGFIDPTKNSGGAKFGLYAALPTGDVIALPPANTLKYAKAQIIHNCADKAASVIDIWVNNSKAFSGVKFREATKYIDLPAGFQISVAITAANSTDTVGAIKQFLYNLEPESNNIFIADGIISQTGYSSNQPLNLHLYTLGKLKSNLATNNDLLFFNGTTDADKIDFNVKNIDGLITTTHNATSYANFYGYDEVLAENMSIDVNISGTQTKKMTFNALFKTLNIKGRSLTILSSGFVNTAANSNGAAFALLAVDTSGTVVEFPQVIIKTAKVQFINNCADKSLPAVDIWVNNVKEVSNLEYLNVNPFKITASEFKNYEFENEFEVVITNAVSNDTSGAIAKSTFKLAENSINTMIINGIYSQSGYSPKKPLEIFLYDKARTKANIKTNVDLIIFNGSTDAVTFDVYDDKGNVLVNNLKYGQFSDYIELPKADYVIQLRDENGSNIIKKYPFSLLKANNVGFSTTNIISGFMNPQNNSNGKPLTMFGVTVGGEVGEYSELNSIEDEELIYGDNYFYPNPSNGYAKLLITFANEINNASISVFDTYGNLVLNKDIENAIVGNNYLDMNFTKLPSGAYSYLVQNGKETKNGFFTIIK